MTDGFTLVDAILWSLAVTLGLAAVWLARPRPPTWDIASFFALSWAMLSRPGPLRLEEGAVPAGGWSGEPEELGPDYDPALRLGPDCTWAALTAADPAVEATLLRRMGHVRVVWFEPPVVDLGPVEVLPAPPAAHDALDALVSSLETRLVLVASTEAQGVLTLLHALQGLRDRVLMVVFVGPRFDAEWVQREFRHEAFDLELAREIPYCTLRTGPGQVLRSPPPVATQRTAIDVVDLGLVAPADLAEPTLGRALRLTIAAVVFAA